MVKGAGFCRRWSGLRLQTVGWRRHGTQPYGEADNPSCSAPTGPRRPPLVTGGPIPWRRPHCLIPDTSSWIEIRAVIDAGGSPRRLCREVPDRPATASRGWRRRHLLGFALPPERGHVLGIRAVYADIHGATPRLHETGGKRWLAGPVLAHARVAGHSPTQWRVDPRRREIRPRSGGATASRGSGKPTKGHVEIQPGGAGQRRR